MTYLRRQIDEIADDPALRWFGAAVALINTLTGLFWLTVQPLANILDRQTEPICWPFFPDCSHWRLLTANHFTLLVVALALAGLTNAVLFVGRNTTKVAFGLLLFLTAIKIALLLQDYRLVLNQHYMAIATTFAFLLMPSKRRILTYLIVSFYFWAGILKLNADWLSGAAIGARRPFGMPASWISVACAYVVVLELAIVPGMLSRRVWIFLAALAQLLIFHTSSFWVVGYFYPMLMALILSIFPLTRVIPDPAVNKRAPHRAVGTRRRLQPAAYAFLVGFGLLQLVPRSLSSDPSVTGEGRMFALNMFDAPLQCQATLTSHHPGFAPAVRRLRVPFLQPRIACDPIVFHAAARNACRAMSGDPSIDIDLKLTTRRGDAEPSTVVDVKSFCTSPPRYALFSHNEWIHAPR